MFSYRFFVTLLVFLAFFNIIFLSCLSFYQKSLSFAYFDEIMMPDSAFVRSGGGDRIEEKHNVPTIVDADANCPFKDSKLYRSIYVYEHPNDGPAFMRSSNNNIDRWPWIAMNNRSKTEGFGHYEPGNPMDQFSLEIIVHDIFTHPASCLRTMNPEQATLFYVPFFNSVDFHQGKMFGPDYSTTPYAQAMLDASDGNYTLWKSVWGLTDEYWKRYHGADHVVVQSEPLHGFSHPRGKRGNYHYLNSQKQLRPPIVISVEISTTFQQMYPKCAAKNVILPYPNPDGRNYNGVYEDVVANLLGEKKLAVTKQGEKRHVVMHYSGGGHGECIGLRRALKQDYSCSTSNSFLEQFCQGKSKLSYPMAMRMATFCPCPGGDSPSAKRMYDAVIAGCIPVILSEDFVWALSTEYDPDMNPETKLNPSDFSIRLDSSNFHKPHVKSDGDCKIRKHDTKMLEQYLLEDITVEEVARLQSNLQRAKHQYSFYSYKQGMTNEVMREGVLPDGGASHALVKSLERRVGGIKWKACEEELLNVHYADQPKGNKC